MLSAWVTNWEDYKQNLQTKFESFQVEENKTNLECPRLQSWFFTCRNCADFHRHNIKSMWPFDDIFLAKKLNLPNFHVIWLLLPTTRWRDQRTGTRQAVYCTKSVDIKSICSIWRRVQYFLQIIWYLIVLKYSSITFKCEIFWKYNFGKWK